MSNYFFQGSNQWTGSMILLHLFRTDEHKIPFYQLLSFSICLSQPVKHMRWWVNRGSRCRRSTRGRSKWGGGEEAVGFSVACRRANSCAGVGAPQLRRGSDIQIWAGLPCGLGDTLQPAPPPLYSGPARSLGMALKKEIKFPPESKAP